MRLVSQVHSRLEGPISLRVLLVSNTEHGDGFDRRQHCFDVVIIDAGMARWWVAFSIARYDGKTAIFHDRPVFDGNALSEVRMWLCGAHGADNKGTRLR